MCWQIRWASTDFLNQTFTNKRSLVFHLQKKAYFSTSLSMVQFVVKAADAGMLDMDSYQVITRKL